MISKAPSDLEVMFRAGLAAATQSTAKNALSLLSDQFKAPEPTHPAKMAPSNLARVYVREREVPEEAELLQTVYSAAQRHALQIQGFDVDIGKSSLQLADLPGLLSLLKLCRDGKVGTVIVRDVDRLGRGFGRVIALETLCARRMRLLDLSADGFVDLHPDAVLINAFRPSRPAGLHLNIGGTEEETP